MPELAEVAFYSRQWDEGIGDRIVGAEVHPSARIFRGGDAWELAKAVERSSYLGPRCHGKQQLLEFSGGKWLWLQLGMTGKLFTVDDPDHETEKHDHLVLRQKKRCLIFADSRMFGRVRLFESRPLPEEWLSLPPEILDDAFTKDYLAEILARRARTPLKPLLLDQAYFPGVGNWMADEILWRAKIDPATLAGEAADQAGTLRRCLRQVCSSAMKVIAPDWGTPPKSWLFQHRWKDGGSCPRCHSDLVRADLRGRTTCWCPTCQKATA